MSRRATIIDVARAADVAVSTASAALNGRAGVAEATRHRVEAAAAEVGWVASVRGRSLSSQRSNTVGLVLQRSPFVLESDPFFGGLLGGIETVLAERGYALVLQLAYSLERTVERMRQLVLSGAVDGLFLADVHLTDQRFDLIAELEVPAVAIGAPVSGPACSVTQEQTSGLSQMLEQLVAGGHRHIAHVSGEPGMVHTLERTTAWREVLRRHHLPEGPLVAGDYTLACGADAVARVFELDPQVTAVSCANDLTAVGFMARCQELGIRVPEDVSVIGFDGIQLGQYTTPALSTVTTDPAGLGRAAAQVLLDRIAGEEPVTVVIDAAVPTPRQSVSTPRTGSLHLA